MMSWHCVTCCVTTLDRAGSKETLCGETVAPSCPGHTELTDFLSDKLSDMIICRMWHTDQIQMQIILWNDTFFHVFGDSYWMTEGFLPNNWNTINMGFFCKLSDQISERKWLGYPFLSDSLCDSQPVWPLLHNTIWAIFLGRLLRLGKKISPFSVARALKSKFSLLYVKTVHKVQCRFIATQKTYIHIMKDTNTTETPKFLPNLNL